MVKVSDFLIVHSLVLKTLLTYIDDPFFSPGSLEVLDCDAVVYGEADLISLPMLFFIFQFLIRRRYTMHTRSGQRMLLLM